MVRRRQGLHPHLRSQRRKPASRCSSSCVANCLREAAGGCAARLLRRRSHRSALARRRQCRTADRMSRRCSRFRRDEIQLERIETCPWSSQADETFGRALAAMHLLGRTDVRGAGRRLHRSASARQHTDGRLGRTSTSRDGSSPICGKPSTRDRCPTATATFERLFARIDEIAGPPEPPSRIHGDLWRGNVLADRQGQHMGDRPCRARRSPRDGSRDDAPVRRFRRALLRRVPGGVAR